MLIIIMDPKQQQQQQQLEQQAFWSPYSKDDLSSHLVIFSHSNAWCFCLENYHYLLARRSTNTHQQTKFDFIASNAKACSNAIHWL